MTFWMDKHGKAYWKKEIDDSYLLNICDGLAKGKGDEYFVNKAVIDNVFEEAFERGLLPLEECKSKRDEAVKAFNKLDYCSEDWGVNQ